MSMKKRILSFVLTIIMVLGLFNGIIVNTNIVNANAGYNDISEHWAKGAIDRLVSVGIVNDSLSNGSVFDADKKITRAETVELILKANLPQDFLKTALSEVKLQTSFNDIGNHRLKGYVELAKRFEIVVGYPDGTFSPDGFITRAEFATMIMNSQKILEDIAAENTGALTFTDVDANHWAQRYIQLASKARLIIGYPDGSFGPDKNITRAEAYTIVNNYYDICFANYAGVVGFIGDNDKIAENISVKLLNHKNGIVVQTTTTNKYGQFRFSVLDKNDYKIEAVDGDYLGIVPKISIPLEVSLLSDVLHMEQILRISGSAYDKNNRPIRNGSLSFEIDDLSISGMTDNNGNFDVKLLPNRTYEVYYFNNGLKTKIGEVAVKKSILTGLVLKEPSNIKDTWNESYYFDNKNNDSDQETPPINPPIDNSTYTRGEWVKLLADKLDFDFTVNFDDMDCFYGDTQDSPYGLAIEMAEAYGILPEPDSIGYDDPEQDIPLFRPDEIVSREFAAYTVVKAMGFIGEYSISCLDANYLKYPNEDALAVMQGFLSLSNNMFYPNEPLTGTDKNRIFLAIDALNDSVIIDTDNPHEEIVFADGVIVDALSNETDYSIIMNQNHMITAIVTKNNVTSSIKPSDVFILPANRNFITGIALKAVTIEDIGNDKLSIDCIEPEISEVLSNINFEGVGIADMNNLVLSEDVTYEYDPYGSIDNDKNVYSLNINAGGSVSVPGTLKFTIANKKLSENLKASGTVSIEIPDITCKVDASIGIVSGIKLKELVLSITEKIKFSGQVNYLFAESGYELTNGLGNTRWEAGKIELGRLPIALGTTGLSIDIVFFYNVDVKGNASITYSIVTKQGIQVKNGSTRLIHDFSQSLDFIALKGSTKAGIGLAVRLAAFNLMDLIGIDGHVGLGISTSFTPHITGTSTVYCSDATVYPYFTLELDTDTAFGMFIKTVYRATYSWDLWNENNSPWKLKLHIENGTKVNECTFGFGSIAGYVYESGSNRAISNARVNIYNGNTLIKTLYSNDNGHYSLSSVRADDYTLKVSATGYQTYTTNITVSKNQATHVETLLMIDRNNIYTQGKVKGDVIDAITGGAISDAVFKVRGNWNNTAGPVLDTGTVQNGTYFVDMIAGNYTIEFAGDDYVTTYINVAVLANEILERHVAMSPVTGGSINGDMRIVLTWGLQPYDLDSHLYGPSIDGNDTFHTWYGSKNYFANGKTIASLDRDDVDSYGPETTTVYELNASGLYSFYVHDYTNLYSNNSTALSTSGAQVRIYSGNMLIATYNVPLGQPGTLWHVFDYDADTDNIIAVNTFSYSSVPGYVRPDQHMDRFMLLTEDVDKTELLKIIELMQSDGTWEKDDALAKLVFTAKDIANNSDATQDMVDSIIETIKNEILAVDEDFDVIKPEDEAETVDDDTDIVEEIPIINLDDDQDNEDNGDNEHNEDNEDNEDAEHDEAEPADNNHEAAGDMNIIELRENES